MRRATLILNPRAGRRRDLAKTILQLIETLRDHGIEVEAAETSGPGDAADLAAIAAASGNEVVFACGGDGTVHEVLQGLVGTSAALGVIPMGTANALARNLGISRDPVEAAAQLAMAETIRIPVGEVSYSRPFKRQARHAADGSGADDKRRYFTVMAGAGPDGALVYSLLASQKSAMGRSAYYAHAARLFVSRPLPPFRVAYRLAGSDLWKEEIAVSAIAARIGDLGGIFGRLTPGGVLHGETLRLFIVRPPGRVSLPAWFVFSQFGAHGLNPWLRVLDVEKFRCEPLSHGRQIHAEADGEWIGSLPVSVRLIPDALSLLAPGAQPRS
jgi:YegS/Rv2252/BmrU family lipid kinase